MDRRVLVIAVLAVLLASSQADAGYVVLAQSEDQSLLTELIDAFLDGLSGVFSRLLSTVEEWLCLMRNGFINFIAQFWCLRISLGFNGQAVMADFPPEYQCECMLCSEALGDYKEHIIDALEWFMGFGNVFAKFVPWQLWATLYGAYIAAVIAKLVVRVALSVGLGLFGFNFPGVS